MTLTDVCLVHPSNSIEIWVLERIHSSVSSTSRRCCTHCTGRCLDSHFVYSKCSMPTMGSLLYPSPDRRHYHSLYVFPFFAEENALKILTDRVKVVDVHQHKIGALMGLYLTGFYNVSWVMAMSLISSNTAGATKKSFASISMAVSYGKNDLILSIIPLRE